VGQRHCHDPRQFDILQTRPWLAGIECISIN